MKKIATAPGGSFNEVTFAEFCAMYPVILVPLQLLRKQLRCTIMGEHFWALHTQRRVECKKIISVTKLRFQLLRCRHALTKRSISSVYLRAASAKISTAISRANLKTAKVHVDSDKITSERTETSALSKKSSMGDMSPM